MPGYVAARMEVIGTGPRVLLVHGSFAGAQLQWMRQRSLAERFQLAFVERSGYPPGPPVEQIDYNDQAAALAEEIEDGTHVVGFSYGGFISLLAAPRRLGSIRSLTVIEPPALGIARESPAAKRLAFDILELYWSGPSDPRAFIERFLPLFGIDLQLPAELPPDLEQGACAVMVERAPWDSVLHLDEIAAAPFPKLVVSGAHSAALDAVCDVLEHRLGAERAVIPGAGHNIPLVGEPFNDLLAGFISRAEDGR